MISRGEIIKLMIGLVCEKEGEVNGDWGFWLRQLGSPCYQTGRQQWGKSKLERKNDECCFSMLTD